MSSVILIFYYSVDLLRPAPASLIVSLQAEVKILLYVEKNGCGSLAFLQFKAELIPIVLGIRITNSTCPCNCFDLAL